MSIARAIGALGALGGGIVSGMEESDRLKQDKEYRGIRNELTKLQLNNAKRTDARESAIDAASQDVTPTLNAPGDGVGPSAVMVDKTAFGENQTDQANAQAQAMNTPEAKTARRLGVLRSVDPMRANQEEAAGMDMKLKRQALAKTIESEGALDFVSQNFQSAPSVADIESGKASLFKLNGVDGFNQSGKIKIRDGAMGKWQVLDLGNGRKVADFTVVDSTGKPLTTMTGRTLEAIHGMSLKEREALADDRFIKGRTLSINERLANDRSALMAAQAEAASARAEASAARTAGRYGAGGGGAGGGAGQATQGGLTPPDFSKLSDDLVKDWAKQVGGGDLGGGKQLTSEQVAAKRIEIESNLRNQWMNNQASSIVQRELSAAASDPAAYKQTYARVKALGYTDQVLAGMGFAAPGGAPEPTKKAAPTKAAAPKADKPEPKAAPKAPEKPGALASMYGAVTDYLGSTGRDYSTPEGKKELQGRVSESKRGGKPLTETETLRAKQAGLI
jgi:hypothetical protein